MLQVVDEAQPLLRALYPASSPQMLCTDRWNGGKRSRSSNKMVELSDSESGSEKDGPSAPSSKFIPFGSVVAASGSSVRVSVSCAAGLAPELPLWGLKMRGDADWAVRALQPEGLVVLREGERALVQARLLDADGRGVPSTERLQRGIVLATPAVSLAARIVSPACTSPACISPASTSPVSTSPTATSPASTSPTATRPASAGVAATSSASAGVAAAGVAATPVHVCISVPTSRARPSTAVAAHVEQPSFMMPYRASLFADLEQAGQGG